MSYDDDPYGHDDYGGRYPIWPTVGQACVRCGGPARAGEEFCRLCQRDLYVPGPDEAPNQPPRTVAEEEADRACDRSEAMIYGGAS